MSTDRTVVDPGRVYFTWPDGRFGYECRGCGACCKGLGIGLDAAGGQVQRLVSLYPGLTPFLRKRGTTWTAFNPRGNCWFLDHDGLCRIERDHGRADKPASCRLFPFNRVFRLGSITIVDYNSVICPLVVTDQGGAGISHASVLEDIAATADSAVIGIELFAERPDEEGQRLVSRERDMAAACFAAADAADPDVAAVWAAQARDGTFERARARVARALEAMTGEPWRAPRAETARVAMWLTPSLRFNELYGPRRYAPRAEIAQGLADAWLVWLHLMGVGAELAGRTLDLREATSIFGESMPLGWLAARWGEAPTMEPGEVELPGDADPHGVVRRFAEACIGNRTRRRPLGDVLEPLLEPHAPAERVVLARLVEPLLGRIRWRRVK